MLTLGSTLAIFLILGISSLGLFWAKRLNIPHTVLLVLIGIGLGFLSTFPHFSFLNEFHLTPELLFYILLPTLIFESAFHMSDRKLVADSGIILLLSVGSFLVSTAAITALLHFALLLIGISIPISITLLFGSLISATDPVAVLALFKEYGVPRRLSLIFEGESLFNDATAVALFIIVLDAIQNGGFTVVSSLEGFTSFFSMLIMGILFGILVGVIFTYLVSATRSSEVANITLTIVLAHITFIMAEVISEMHFFGSFSLHISPIISTTIASLIMGNYGRTKLNPHAEAFVSTFWEQLAFMANSIIFILIGLLMAQSPLFHPSLLLIICITVLVVALSRAFSIYPIISLYNLFQSTDRSIPTSWQHLMAWGSLRGALAVTMVLLIPDDLIVSGWSLTLTPKEFLLAITVGCIAATLFIKATTIKRLVRTFNLDRLTPMEEAEYQEARALIHHQVAHRLVTYEKRGYIDPDIAEQLQHEHSLAFQRACKQVSTLSRDRRDDLVLRVLRIYAIGIEKNHLKLLYHHHEVTERVYRHIQGKLRLQLEAIEAGNLSPDLTIHLDEQDIFERFFGMFRYVLRPADEAKQHFAEKYMYYRAQVIISRKVLKEFTQLENVSNTIFTPGGVKHIYHLYNSFKKNAQRKLQHLSAKDPEAADRLAASLATYGVRTIEEFVLNDIFRKELITPKLYITLREELGIVQK